MPAAAADDPQTRAALGAYQAGALRWLGGGAVAVVLGILAAVAAVTVAGDSGQRVPGAGLVVVVLVVGGAAALAAGVGALARHRRWARALARQPWRTGELRVAGPAVLAFDPSWTDPVGEPVLLRLTSTAVWRTRAVQQMDGAVVRAAPVGGREWVFTADGVPTVYGARVAGRR